MTTAIANFESAKLPSFLRSAEGSVANSLAALATGSFPVLSIKGKRFAVVRNKEETILMRPDDDETPANAIEVVIVNAATNYAKVFYASGYTEGSKEKPTCYSNDGQAPAPDAADKQAKKCAVCPHNAWGSSNNGKGKACSDSLRLAVSKPDDLADPMLLRVPPASLKAVTEYASLLSRKGAPIEAVVTKLKFVVSEPTPRLEFSPVRFLDEDAYAQAIEVSKMQVTQQIIGALAIAAKEDDTPAKPAKPAVKEADDEEDVKPAKAAKPAKEEDDEAPAPAPEKPKKSPTATKAADLAAKLKASMDDDDDDN